MAVIDRAVASVETALASRVADAADGVAVDAVAVAVAREMAPWDRRLTAVLRAAASAGTRSSRLAARCMVIVVGRRWPTGAITSLHRVKVGMSIMHTGARTIVAIAMSTKSTSMTRTRMVGIARRAEAESRARSTDRTKRASRVSQGNLAKHASLVSRANLGKLVSRESRVSRASHNGRSSMSVLRNTRRRSRVRVRLSERRRSRAKVRHSVNRLGRASGRESSLRHRSSLGPHPPLRRLTHHGRPSHSWFGPRRRRVIDATSS